MKQMIANLEKELPSQGPYGSFTAFWYLSPTI